MIVATVKPNRTLLFAESRVDMSRLTIQTIREDYREYCHAILILHLVEIPKNDMIKKDIVTSNKPKTSFCYLSYIFQI